MTKSPFTAKFVQHLEETYGYDVRTYAQGNTWYLDVIVDGKCEIFMSKHPSHNMILIFDDAEKEAIVLDRGQTTARKLIRERASRPAPVKSMPIVTIDEPAVEEPEVPAEPFTQADYVSCKATIKMCCDLLDEPEVDHHQVLACIDYLIGTYAVCGIEHAANLDESYTDIISDLQLAMPIPEITDEELFAMLDASIAQDSDQPETSQEPGEVTADEKRALWAPQVKSDPVNPTPAHAWYDAPQASALIHCANV